MDAATGEEAIGIATSDGKSGGRHVGGEDLRVRKFVGESDGDATRTSADIDDRKIAAGKALRTASTDFAKSEAVESDFDEVFGFLARDENVGRDFEIEAPEFLVTGEVLDGFAMSAPTKKIKEEIGGRGRGEFLRDGRRARCDRDARSG